MKKFKKPINKSYYQPNCPHNTVNNANKAGESAFKARIPFYNNPYKDNPCKSAWIRGYMRATKAFNESLRFSARIQETLGFEEVED